MSEWRYCRLCNGTGNISSGLWTDKEGQRVLVDRVTRTCERCKGEGILREPETPVEIAERRERNRLRQQEYRAWQRHNEKA